MEGETATAIVNRWLVTDPKNAERLRTFYRTQGVEGLRSAAEAYITGTAGVSGIAETLLRWGVAHGPQLSTRDNVLKWICQQVDWGRVGSGLADGAVG